jgi:hypothetical protein
MENTLIALRHNQEYECFPLTDSGVARAVGFLGEEGGAIYRLDYYIDKHGDTLPRSTKVAEVLSESK